MAEEQEYLRLKAGTLNQRFGHTITPARTAKGKAFSLLDRSIAAAAQTEESIAGRGSSINFMQQVLQRPQMAQEHPFKTGMAAVGAPMEALESIPANIGLGIQQRKGVGQTFRDVAQGVSGQRPAQLGDIARASGLPVISSEPVASATGLLSAGSPAMATKFGRQAADTGSRFLTGVGRNLKNVSTFKQRKALGGRMTEAVEDAVDVAGEKLGKEIDTLSVQHAANQSATPINLTTAIEKLSELTKDNPAILKQLREANPREGKGYALIEDLLTNPDPKVVTSITLKDAQAIKSTISAAVPVARAAKQSASYGTLRSLRNIRNQIRAEEVKAVPELADRFKEFKALMDNYRLVSSSIQPGQRGNQIFGQGKLLRDADMRVALKEILAHAPKGKPGVGGTPNTFADVIGAARTAGVGRTIGRAAWPLGLGIGGYFLGRATGRRGYDSESDSN